jgi:hypothetical protein
MSSGCSPKATHRSTSASSNSSICSKWRFAMCPRWKAATASLRAVAQGSGRARTPGVSLLGSLASSLRYAILPCRPRAGCAFASVARSYFFSSEVLQRQGEHLRADAGYDEPVNLSGLRSCESVEVGPLVSLVDLNQRPLSHRGPNTLRMMGFRPRRCSSSHHSSTLAVG